jgi:hypothetical protein
MCVDALTVFQRALGASLEHAGFEGIAQVALHAPGLNSTAKTTAAVHGILR